MQGKTLSIALLAATLAAPMYADAQIAPIIPAGSGVATVITFQMQLNLTNLQPDLERVRLACVIQSPSYSYPMQSGGSGPEVAAQYPSADLYVSQGKAVGSVSVQYPIATAYLASDAVGKQAQYQCGVLGYSTSLRRWDLLSDQQTVAAFKVSPSAPVITGTFVW